MAFFGIYLILYFIVNSNTIKANFSCADGKSIKAVFHTGADGYVNLTLSNGTKYQLPVTASAGGARYANKSESVVFWNTGDTTTLDEKSKTTYTNCTQK